VISRKAAKTQSFSESENQSFSGQGKHIPIHPESHLPLRLCAFARENLHAPVPLTKDDPATHPFNPIKSYIAQSRKAAKFLRSTKSQDRIKPQMNRIYADKRKDKKLNSDFVLRHLDNLFISSSL